MTSGLTAESALRHHQPPPAGHQDDHLLWHPVRRALPDREVSAEEVVGSVQLSGAQNKNRCGAHSDRDLTRSYT